MIDIGEWNNQKLSFVQIPISKKKTSAKHAIKQVIAINYILSNICLRGSAIFKPLNDIPEILE